MALKKHLTIGSLFAVLATSGFANLADAQQARINTPAATFEHRAIELPGKTGPLVTPGVFQYDAQAFAPFEFTNDKQLEPSVGFFFSVDKVLTSISLPDSVGTGLPISGVPAVFPPGAVLGGIPIGGIDVVPTGDLSNITPSGNSWTWGERYTFGWISEEDHGWEGSFQDITGAITFRQRDSDLDLDGEFDAIDNFDNLEQTLSTTYRVGELNRVFRQVLKNGDTFEPYFGGRYTQLDDESLDQFTQPIFNADINGDGMIDPPLSDLVVESQLNSIVTNSAIGFQLGGRHRRRRGRFLFTTDGSVAASHNRQRVTVENFNVVDRGLLDAGGGALVTSTDEFFSDSSFVPSIDLEFAVSYNVTRDITLRLGSNFNYLWQNVARANIAENISNPNFNSFDFFNEDNIFASIPSPFEAGDIFDNGEAGLFDNNFIAAGFTFGVEWKR